ncbi:MAG: hypothetical protein AAF646_14120 [Pseudomonadota bacterium]
MIAPVRPATALFLAGLALPLPSVADPAEVLRAEARETGGTWTVSVTLRHPDTGWDDYADGWRIVTEAGDIVGTRELLHPHVNEQPFTRSLSGVALPTGEPLFVESSTNVTGWSGEKLPLTLP